MFINVGSGRLLRKKDVIGIFDLDTASHEKDTREFLKKAEKDGVLETCGGGLPKAFVVTVEKDGNMHVYLTTLAAKSLLGRVEGSGKLKVES